MLKNKSKQSTAEAYKCFALQIYQKLPKVYKQLIFFVVFNQSKTVQKSTMYKNFERKNTANLNFIQFQFYKPKKSKNFQLT